MRIISLRKENNATTLCGRIDLCLDIFCTICTYMCYVLAAYIVHTYSYVAYATLFLLPVLLRCCSVLKCGLQKRCLFREREKKQQQKKSRGHPEESVIIACLGGRRRQATEEPLFLKKGGGGRKKHKNRSFRMSKSNFYDSNDQGPKPLACPDRKKIV